MIKLIATDMDGTFLKDDKTFDLSFFKTYQKLKQENIQFVIASGNQYQRLFQKFLPISTELVYIAENGSLIVNGTKTIYKNKIKQEDLKVIDNIFKNYPEIFIIMCGEKSAYVKNVNQEYETVVKTYYCAYQFVEDFDHLNDDILKIAVYDPNNNIVDFLEAIKPHLPKDLKVVTSGNMWMDIQNKSINKGIAMTKLQQILKIDKDECMAFGDQMNDYELLQSVKYGYAMANAVDPIKEIAYETCLDNNQQGVICKIKEYLNTL